MLNFFRKTLLFSLILLSVNSLQAQEDGDAVNTYSPYTLYGIGDMARPGLTRNKGMGGIVTGMRDKAHINQDNPASLSIQDSLAVLIDFAAGSKNTYSRAVSGKTSANSFYFDYFAMSVRLGKGLAFGFGIKPVSDIGYDIERRETDPNIIYNMGDIKYRYIGEGGVNQVYWGIGWKLFKYFSIGANGHYYFGSINRNYMTEFETNSSYGDIYSVQKSRISKIGFTVGVQAHFPLSTGTNDKVTVGVTYQPKAKLVTRVETQTVVTSDIVSDTTSFNKNYPDNIFMPTTINAGFSVELKNRLVFGMDYTYQDWSDFNIGTASQTFNFQAGKSHTYKVGIEYTPNPYHLKNKLKRWNYRAGGRYSDTYMTCNGTKIKEYGITFGVGIPINKLGTKINFAVEAGRRGSKKDGLVEENFATFTIGISIYDLWFRKYHYD